jgi:uncharacterized protein (TIGR02722 family)
MLARFSILAVVAVLASGCANTSPVLGGKNISYGDTKAVELVTNEFGSTDLQMIAESMTRSLAQSGILQGRPVVQVYDVKNKTSEYIDTREITTSIKTQLMKTGTARFASDNTDMQSQVDQLKLQNQSGLYKKSTVSKTGNMVAAKYRLEGSISSTRTCSTSSACNWSTSKAAWPNGWTKKKSARPRSAKQCVHGSA